MIIFDYILTNPHEKILFYNLSGLCELRINKRHLENKTYDKCVAYIRNKLKDLSITSIMNFNIGISFNDMRYNIIIRNIYREKILRYYSDNNYEDYVRSIACGKCDTSDDRKCCYLCVHSIDYILWDDDSNDILFDDIELVLAMIGSDNGCGCYEYFSERLKRDHIICHTIVEHDLDKFKHLPNEVKTDIDFIHSLGLDTIYSIYDYLDENIRNVLINSYGITSPY